MVLRRACGKIVCGKKKSLELKCLTFLKVHTFVPGTSGQDAGGDCDCLNELCEPIAAAVTSVPAFPTKHTLPWWGEFRSIFDCFIWAWLTRVSGQRTRVRSHMRSCGVNRSANADPKHNTPTGTRHGRQVRFAKETCGACTGRRGRPRSGCSWKPRPSYPSARWDAGPAASPGGGRPGYGPGQGRGGKG